MQVMIATECEETVLCCIVRWSFIIRMWCFRCTL